MGHVELGRAFGRPPKAALIAVLALVFRPMPAVAAPQPSDLIQRPDWERIELPSTMRFYPRDALAHGITGKVVLICAVTAIGALSACSVDEETPPGWGFGAATLRYAAYFRMKPIDYDGKPTEGRHVRVPVRWDLDVH